VREKRLAERERDLAVYVNAVQERFTTSERDAAVA
jgi:hypothetical protein